MIPDTTSAYVRGGCISSLRSPALGACALKQSRRRSATAAFRKAASAGSQLARNAVATGSAAALIAGSNPPSAAIAIAQHRLTTTRCGVTAM